VFLNEILIVFYNKRGDYNVELISVSTGRFVADASLSHNGMDFFFNQNYNIVLALAYLFKLMMRSCWFFTESGDSCGMSLSWKRQLGVKINLYWLLHIIC